MSDDLSSRLRDIAEEYLYLDAPLKELKSKLLHEAADKYDDTCVEIARMNIEISNLKVELIKTKAVRNLPEKTKLAKQLTEARALLDAMAEALNSWQIEAEYVNDEGYDDTRADEYINGAKVLAKYSAWKGGAG